MKTIIIFGLLGATMSAPIIPQHLLSASNSNELLLNLNTAQLQPLQLQSLFNSWISPFSGIRQQQQTQIPGLSLFALSPLDRFPDQITFPGQVSFAQKTQVGQLDPLQPPTPLQTQQGPDHTMLPYVSSFKMPQEQAQAHLIISEESPLKRILRTPESPGHYDVVLQYYPLYMLLPWEQPQQTATRSPPQTGQQQFEEQIPFYTQYGYIPQQAEHIIPGQQQLTFDTFIGTAPETAVMPEEGVISYLPKEILNFRHASGGIFISSPSQKPSTTNFFASTVDPTITPEFMEEKAKTGSLKEP